VCILHVWLDVKATIDTLTSTISDSVNYKLIVADVHANDI